MIWRIKKVLPGIVTGSLALGLLVCGMQCAATVPPPPAKVVIVPARPHPNAVWVEGRWVWKRHRHEYVWAPGHWKYRRGHRRVVIY